MRWAGCILRTVRALGRQNILLAADRAYDLRRTRIARGSSRRFVRRADDRPPPGAQLACTVWLAVALHRSHAVARWVSIGLPLAYIATIPASRAGGGLVAGAFWIAVGALLATGTLVRRPMAAVATA